MKNLYYLVVMPDRDFIDSMIYNLGLKPVLEENEKFKHNCLNVYDNTPSEIIKGIDQAAFVIVCTARSNLDVYYIAGICHSRIIRTILISETQRDVPVLLRKYPVIFYGSDSDEKVLSKLRQELRIALSEIYSDSYRVNTPTEDFFPVGKKKPIFEGEYFALKKERDQLKEKNRILETQLEQIRSSTGSRSFLIKRSDEIEKDNKYRERIKFHPAVEKINIDDRTDD